MKWLVSILAMLLFLCAAVKAQLSLNAGSQKQMVMTNLSSMPLSFTENRGQWDQKALFKAEAGGATFWFCRDEVVYQFSRDTDELIEEDMPQEPTIVKGMPTKFNHPRYKKESLILRAQFVGANPNPEIAGKDRLSYNCNYFYGNYPSKWAKDVPNYSVISYKDVFPGIDLRYHGDAQGMKYDFIVSPGADISRIKIKYDGVENLSVTNQGDLEAQTIFGPVYERIPQIYQEIDGHKREISGHYILLESGTFGFAIEDSVNPSYPVVIDPELVYSSYLGGDNLDAGRKVAIDSDRNFYVMGYTQSNNFPIYNSYDPSYNGGYDVFVTKFASSGNSVLYCTYLGGSEFEYGYAIALDDFGNVYLTGSTGSSDFPIVYPYDGIHSGDNDAFVAKLNALGDSLIYSTYLGGNGSDIGYGIAVDGSGCAYITGVTNPPDFPLVNPYDDSYNGGPWDAFVTKFSTTGNSLIYSTFLGGNADEYGCGIAIDELGNCYITGWTYSSDFPMVNSYDWSYNGDRDAFVAKFSTSGSSLIYSTFLGGSAWDESFAISVDGNGSASISGYTWSTDFPTYNAYDGSINGNIDAFVTKLNPAGNSLIFSTYLGGSGDDMSFGSAIDNTGNIYITGYTASSDFPTVNPYDDSYNGSSDVFVTVLNGFGNSIIYSTYLGGNDGEAGYDIEIDGSGNTYITGDVLSMNFPVVNAYDYSFNGGDCDAFVAKFGAAAPSNSAIRGSVTDVSSNHINGVIVTNINQGRVDTTTGGQYAFYGLSAGTYSISFAHPDYYDTIVTGIDLPESDTITVDMIMRAKIYGIFTGVVTDSSLNPIAGATVTDHNQGSFTTTDTTGHFILNGLLSGSHNLSVSSIGYRTLELHDIIIPENDTLILNVMMAVWHPDVTLWFGTPDGSPLAAPLIPGGSNLTIDLYIKTAPWTYISNLHIPLGALNPYIDDMLSTTYGQYYNPLNQWYRAQFLNQVDSVPGPLWISQSFLGVADTLNIHNAKLHFETPTKILSYVIHIPDNSGIAGDTVQCLGPGNHPQYGGLQFRDSTGSTFQDIAVAYSPLLFTLSPDYGFVMGSVTNAFGMPLDSVQIAVGGPTPGQFLSDDDGNYFIPYLFHGQYNLTFSRPQYRDTTVSNITVQGLDTTVINVQLNMTSIPDVVFWIGNIDGSPITARTGGPLNIDVYAMTTQATYGGGIHFPLALLNSCFDSLMSQDRGQYYYPFTQWDLAEYQIPNGSPPNPDGWSSQSFLGWADLSGGPNPWLHLNIPTKILTFTAEVADDPALIGNTIHCLQIGQHPTLGGLSVTDTLEGFSFSNYVFISPVTFEAAPDNEYLPGDVNMYNGNWPPSVIGGDLTFLVNYYIGNINIEPCMLGGFWASADANGDCLVNGGDVTKLVNYFRGIGSMRYCPDHEPLWHNPGELPSQSPPGWPNCHGIQLGDNPLDGSKEGGR